jgi:hypothetical protein
MFVSQKSASNKKRLSNITILAPASLLFVIVFYNNTINNSILVRDLSLAIDKWHKGNKVDLMGTRQVIH